MRLTFSRGAAFRLLAIVGSLPLLVGTGSAADVRVLATKSTLLLINEVGPIFERETGHKLVITTDLPVETKRKIDAGAL